MRRLLACMKAITWNQRRDCVIKMNDIKPSEMSTASAEALALLCGDEVQVGEVKNSAQQQLTAAMNHFELLTKAERERRCAPHSSGCSSTPTATFGRAQQRRSIRLLSSSRGDACALRPDQDIRLCYTVSNRPESRRRALARIPCCAALVFVVVSTVFQLPRAAYSRP